LYQISYHLRDHIDISLGGGAAVRPAPPGPLGDCGQGRYGRDGEMKEKENKRMRTIGHRELRNNSPEILSKVGSARLGMAPGG
jgi:hypothetical protein